MEKHDIFPLRESPSVGFQRYNIVQSPFLFCFNVVSPLWQCCTRLGLPCGNVCIHLFHPCCNVVPTHSTLVTILRLFYGLIRLLFPELPNEEFVHLATDTVSGIASHSTEESWTSSMLLHPLLFPRLYPPLFTLYALDNDRFDSAYWEQIQLLNKRSDWALMTFVGMQRYDYFGFMVKMKRIKGLLNSIFLT